MRGSYGTPREVAYDRYQNIASQAAQQHATTHADVWFAIQLAAGRMSMYGREGLAGRPLVHFVAR